MSAPSAGSNNTNNTTTTAFSSPAPTKSKDASSSTAGSDAGAHYSSHPIRPLLSNNPQAKIGSQIVHPAVLAALFALRFGALVSDPVGTMSGAIPVVVAVQVAYAVMCLPPIGSSQSSGSRSSSSSSSKLKRPGEKKGGLSSSSSSSSSSSEGGAAEPNVAVTVIVALVISTIAILPLHAILVLFGAPFLEFVPHTLLCAFHISMLGFFPLLYTRGVSDRDWLEILSGRAPFDEVFGGLVGVTAGAWLGAVPIPLDWDREWQKWPVTIVAGVYMGYLIGKLVGGTVVFGKRFG